MSRLDLNELSHLVLISLAKMEAQEESAVCWLGPFKCFEYYFLSLSLLGCYFTLICVTRR